MKVISSAKSLSVKSPKSTTSIGGVSNSVSMMFKLMLVIMSILSTVRMSWETAGTNQKTTETSADAEGEYLMPALVASYMGSVHKSIQLRSDCLRVMGDKTPEWAKKLLTKVDETKQEVTSKFETLGKDFSEFKEKTRDDIHDINTSVAHVKDSLESVQLNQKKLEKKVEEMERKRSTWETGVQEDMRKFSDRPRMAPGQGGSGGPSDEDIKLYEYEYNKMRRSVGLAPFTDDDFEKIRLHLVKNAVPTTTENILSASLMDFWSADLGIDQPGIELLSGLMEKCWWGPMPKRKTDADGQKAIYARFKDETGRLTCYARAKAMNEMCKTKEIEPRRVLMDVCPQLERRFGVLNKLQHRFRHETEKEQGGKTYTRIEMEENTINLQYRFDETELWRTLDVQRHFKNVPIPGIRYDDKVPYASKPKAYKFQGVKTPPGRCRKNLPVRNPERNPPIMNSRLNNNTDSGNNNTAAEETAAAAVRSMGNAELNARDIPVTITIPKSASALSQHLLDLDGLDPMSSKANPLSDVDPTKPTFVHPAKTYGYLFDAARAFKKKGDNSGQSSSSSSESTSSSSSDTSTETVVAASTGTKRGRTKSNDTGEPSKTKKASTTKKNVTSKPTGNQDLRKLLLSQRKKADDAKDDDPEEHDDEDTINLDVDDSDKFSIADLGTPGKRD